MTILFSAGGFTFEADKILIEKCDCSSMWVASFMTSQLCKCKCRSTFCHMTIGYSLCSYLEDFLFNLFKYLRCNFRQIPNSLSTDLVLHFSFNCICQCYVNVEGVTSKKIGENIVILFNFFYLTNF